MQQFRFDFDFLRNRYDYELQRKEQLTTALTMPVAVLSVLGGAIVAMARSFSYRETFLNLSFGSVLSADGLAFVVCLVYLAQAYHRQTYVFLPLLSDIDKSREEFLEFASAMAGGEAEVIEAFEHQMRQRMIDAADRKYANERRAQRSASPGAYSALCGARVDRNWRTPVRNRSGEELICRNHPTRDRHHHHRCH